MTVTKPVVFFHEFDRYSGKPWLTKRCIYLLFEYLHLLKCIRNNPLTEKCKIFFEDDDKQQIVDRWSDLKDLFKPESGCFLKQSKYGLSVYVYKTN